MSDIDHVIDRCLEELRFNFIQSSGPGGQNINKVTTAVQLRFHVAGSPSLPAGIKSRLSKIAGKRMDKAGWLQIEARQFRTREQNRKAAIRRFVDLVKKASVPPKPRLKTHPTTASRERRLETKKRKSSLKRARRMESID